MDYKEIWQEFYDDAIEKGMTSSEAGEYAFKKREDHLNDIADSYIDDMQYGGAYEDF